jgi:type I thyroxine 5'-deiodinase
VAHAKEFTEIAGTYAAVADFVVIYVSEAHPIGTWTFETHRFQFAAHKTLEDRFEAAGHVHEFGYECPILVDPMDDNCTYAYDPLPERLYIILNGYCVFKSAEGPMGYKVSEVGDWLAIYCGNE